MAHQYSTLAKLKLDSKGLYRVGDKLGEGAQGAVFKVVRNETGEDSEWAVKVTPFAKPTRNRRSEAEVNSRYLSQERLMYQNSLVKFQGTMIPKTPGFKMKLQVYGQSEEAGWDFLVMQQMENELFAVLSSLPKAGSFIAVGPLAQRMLAIFRAIHGEGFVVTDVKPENFMIAPGSESIVDRLRLVDLGLLKTYRDFTASGHAPNAGTNGLSGTPLYASLNTHSLQTPSRRDDVEALLYLIGEIVICLNAAQQGKTAQWKKKGSFLPWSHGKSDEEVGELKEAQVSNIHSEYYSRMPQATAHTLKQCLDEVRSYTHRKEPNYDLLNGMFSTLNVPVTSKLADKKRASPSKAHPANRSPRLSARGGRVRYKLTSDSESSDDDEMMEINDGAEGVEPMDIDTPAPTDIDTPAPTKATRPSATAKKNRKFCAAILVAKNGPFKGQKWIIQEGEDAKWVVGKNPSKPGYKPFIIDDASVDKTHARIELVESTSSLRLLVWDLKSKKGTFVDGRKVSSSNTASAAFASNVLHFGDIEFEVRRAPNP